MKQLISGPTRFRRIEKSKCCWLIKSISSLLDIYVDRKPRRNAKELIRCQCRPAEEREVWELSEDGTQFSKVTKMAGCGDNCINRYVIFM